MTITPTTVKKITATLSACLAAGLVLAGCSGSNTGQSPASSPAASSPAAAPSLTPEGGKLVDTDLQAKVFKDSGLKVTIDPAAKTAAFQLVDPNSGENFTDHYTFDYTAKTMSCHRFVSAMQKAFDYTVSLETGELTAVVGDDGTDAIPGLKQMGRFDKAQSDRVKGQKDLEAWFKARYGKTIEEAATA